MAADNTHSPPFSHSHLAAWQGRGHWAVDGSTVPHVSVASSSSALSTPSSELPSDLSSEWPASAERRSLSPVEEAAMLEENHLFSPSTAHLRRSDSASDHTTEAHPARFFSHASDGSKARKRQAGAHKRATDLASEDDTAALHDSGAEQRTPNGITSRHLTSRAVASESSSLLPPLSAATRRWRKAVCGRHCPSLTFVVLVRACLLFAILAAVALVLSLVSWAGLPSHRLQSVQVSLPIDLSTPSTSSLLWGSAAVALAPSDARLPVHVIASCANRLASLQSCLPTWLNVPEVSSVTLVDWGSELSLQAALRDHITEQNGRLRVVALDEPLPWMLSTSVNLALHFLPPHSPSLLLKLDCDSVLHPQFVQQHPLSELDFYAGDWRAARDENEMHLNGVLFVHTRSLLSVNGYDERLQSYGYDDTNLHERLQAASLTARPLHYQYIQHLRHNDSLRTAKQRPRTDDSQQQQRRLQQQASTASSTQLAVVDFNAETGGLSVEELIGVAPPFFATQLHRVLLSVVPMWNASMSGATFRVALAEQPHSYRASLQQLPMRLENSVSREAWLSGVQEAAEITLRRVGLLVDQLPKATDLHEHVHYLMRLVCFWTTDSEQPPLVVHVQHGLSNRLRALASAASVAAAVGMPLKVIWLSDHHCAARFSDLFRVRSELSEASLLGLNHSSLSSVAQLRSQDVWESSASLPAVDLLSAGRFDQYNYMEPEMGAVKNQPIEVSSGRERRSVYIKTAYRLSHTAGLSDVNLNQALSSLILSESVVALLSTLLQRPFRADGSVVPIEVGSVRAPVLDSAIGVHIRHQPPREEVVGLRANEYPSAAWAALVAARELSSADVYIRAMRQAAAEPLKHFYVSSDDTAIIAEMKATFGTDHILHLDTNDCHDRSTRCTQLALADQLLLAQTSRLLGSVWSSYSEVAALWRLRPIRYPQEVSDVVERTLAASESIEQSRAVEGSRPFFLTPELLTLHFTDERIAPYVLPAAARATDCRVELFSVLGERCSGTDYLQRLLEANFDLSSTDQYHSRHFFGIEDSDHPYQQAECVLFVGVVRGPMEWLESFYQHQWQLDQWRYPDWHSFLTQPIVSYTEPQMNATLSQLPAVERGAARQAMLEQPVWNDRNFAEPELSGWQDVFQLRRVKAAFMVDTFPLLVNKYVLVRLEDLTAHTDHFLHLLQLWFNLRPKLASLTTEQADLTAESPMASYVGAQMESDVSDAAGRLASGHHIPASALELIERQLDWDVEMRLGYDNAVDEPVQG